MFKIMSVDMSTDSSTAGLYMDDNYYSYYKPGMKMTDGLPDSIMAIVHPHWSQFPPVNPMIPHFFGVMLFFLWTLSVFGNTTVLYIFMKTPSLRTATNVFVINLAASDLIMMTTHGPLVAFNIFFRRYWMYSEFACSLYGFSGAICGVSSILSMVVIGYDRYNVIVRGFNGVKITPLKAFAIITCIWSYSIAIALPALLGVWGSYILEGFLYTCSYNYLQDDRNNRSYILFSIVFNYIIPMIMVVFFYSSIVKVVWAHEYALKEQAKKMNVETLRSNADTNAESAEIRIAKVAVTNVSIWAGTWSPYAFVVFLPLIGMQSVITPIISQIPSFVAKSASAFNPIVYAISHPKYREALMNELPCLGIGEQAPIAAQTGETATTKENA